MSPQRLISAGWILAMSLVTAVACAAAPAELRHNPFARPAWETVADERGPIPVGPATPVSMDLRATMVSRQDSLANVSGKVVAVGDSVQGYELVEVLEDHAVFERQGQRIIVYVRPPQVENDE